MEFRLRAGVLKKGEIWPKGNMFRREIEVLYRVPFHFRQTVARKAVFARFGYINQLIEELSL
jgi:hypothetical protein